MEGSVLELQLWQLPTQASRCPARVLPASCRNLYPGRLSGSICNRRQDFAVEAVPLLGKAVFSWDPTSPQRDLADPSCPIATRRLGWSAKQVQSTGGVICTAAEDNA